MKIQAKHLLIFLINIVILLTFIGCRGEEAELPEVSNDEIPPQIQAIMDDTLSLAANYALQLDLEWADEYAACLASEEGRDFAGYNNLKSTLDQFRLEFGAYSIYVLTDMDAEDGFFELTVDSSENPKDWMTQYEAEGQFYMAQTGVPCAALSAANNESGDPVWSAFAPIYDSQESIVGILGIDCPAPEVLNFPRWNRDSEEWNGITVEY